MNWLLNGSGCAADMGSDVAEATAAGQAHTEKRIQFFVHRQNFVELLEVRNGDLFRGNSSLGSSPTLNWVAWALKQKKMSRYL